MTVSSDKNEVLEVYDQEFYSEQINGSTLSASIVIPLILKLIPDVKSVVDVGCGVGTWLAEFKRNGIDSVRGFDGGNPPMNYLLIDEDEYKKADFTVGYPDQEKVDLAISLEVAEHLDEKHAEAFVKNICGLSDVILFSAAIPNQGGTHHVNERWPSYWADIFDAEGFQFFDIIRPQIWYDKRVKWWYRQNIFLVAKKDRSDLVEIFNESAASQATQLDIVHPDIYLINYDMIECLEKKLQQLRSENQLLFNTNKKLHELGASTKNRSDAALHQYQKKLDSVQKSLNSVMNSNSWKLMSIPRSLGKVTRRLRRR